MADSCFQEVVLHGPFHQLVADGRPGYFFVVFDRFVVVALEGGEVGDFEVEFVGQSAVGLDGLASFHSNTLPLRFCISLLRVGVKNATLTPPHYRSRTTPPPSRTPPPPASDPLSPPHTPRPDSADGSPRAGSCP